MKLGIASLVVVSMLTAQSAHAGEAQGRTYWRAETSGIPVSTEVGRWIDVDGRNVQLEFTGGHLLGAGTTFEARWLTPYTTRNRVARFEGEWEVENFNQIGDEIRLRSMFRFRERGEDWYPWMEMGRVFKRGSNSMGAGTSFWGGDRDQVQFEWRLKGEIKAPTYLAGSADLSVN